MLTKDTSYLLLHLVFFLIVFIKYQSHTDAVVCVCMQDPTNLQGKLQKHENFAAELSANQARIETVTKTGEELIAQDHYNKDHIRYLVC